MRERSKGNWFLFYFLFFFYSDKLVALLPSYKAASTSSGPVIGPRWSDDLSPLLASGSPSRLSGDRNWRKRAMLLWELQCLKELYS